jgi:hypothetical protein
MAQEFAELYFQQAASNQNKALYKDFAFHPTPRVWDVLTKRPPCMTKVHKTTDPDLPQRPYHTFATRPAIYATANLKKQLKTLLEKDQLTDKSDIIRLFSADFDAFTKKS